MSQEFGRHRQQSDARHHQRQSGVHHHQHQSDVRYGRHAAGLVHDDGRHLAHGAQQMQSPMLTPIAPLVRDSSLRHVEFLEGAVRNELAGARDPVVLSALLQHCGSWRRRTE